MMTLDPLRAEELLASLQKATVEKMRTVPGFVSANVHVSRDRRRVVNYAQWRSREEMAAMHNDADAQIHTREAQRSRNRSIPCGVRRLTRARRRPASSARGSIARAGLRSCVDCVAAGFDVEAVTDALDRVQHRRMLGITLDLLAEAADVDPKIFHLTRVLRPPDRR